MTDTSTLDMQGVVLHNRYEIVSSIGSGAFSSVYKALDRVTSRYVAIKANKWGVVSKQARHVSRELAISHHLSTHRNANVMVHELMKADLRSTIRNGQLGDEDIMEIMYQLAASIRQLHAAGIVHRDIKPNNVLLDTTPDDTEFVVKMTDFGLSRGVASIKEGSPETLTDYVITRWYRPPEILLGDTHYTCKADVWSLGCVFAEMWHGAAIFRGKNSQNQLSLILEYTGTPQMHDLSPGCLAMPALVESVKYGPRTRSRPIASLFTGGKHMPPPLCLDLIQSMLNWNPARRPSMDDVLRHPFFASYFSASDLTCVPTFDDRLEAAESKEANFRAHCFESMYHFNPHLIDETIKELLRHPRSEHHRFINIAQCAPLHHKMQRMSQSASASARKPSGVFEALHFIRPASGDFSGMLLNTSVGGGGGTITQISPQLSSSLPNVDTSIDMDADSPLGHMVTAAAAAAAAAAATTVISNNSSSIPSSPTANHDTEWLLLGSTPPEQQHMMNMMMMMGGPTPSVSASSSSSSLSSTLLVCPEKVTDMQVDTFHPPLAASSSASSRTVHAGANSAAVAAAACIPIPLARPLSRFGFAV